MVDGDKSLVIADDKTVEIAERNMENIYPLYYEMGVAEKEYINSESIYKSLILAFKANIGEYSNNITKIFNTSDEPSLKVVSWLTAENNYVIDYAKTLFMPSRPDSVNKEIKRHISGKLPHFFKYAKDKNKNQVVPEHKGIIDKLDHIIPNRNLFIKSDSSAFDYRVLMRHPHNHVNDEVVETYKELTRNKKRYMHRHFKDKYGKERERAFDFMARKRLMAFGYTGFEIVNILVAALYRDKVYKNKTILWDSFDKELFANIRFNTKGTKRCESCGVRIEVNSNRVKYCRECSEKIRKEQNKKADIKYRNKIRDIGKSSNT